jgi:hypothetical protein
MNPALEAALGKFPLRHRSNFAAPKQSSLNSTPPRPTLNIRSSKHESCVSSREWATPPANGRRLSPCQALRSPSLAPLSSHPLLPFFCALQPQIIAASGTARLTPGARRDPHHPKQACETPLPTCANSRLFTSYPVARGRVSQDAVSRTRQRLLCIHLHSQLKTTLQRLILFTTSVSLILLPVTHLPAAGRGSASLPYG